MHRFSISACLCNGRNVSRRGFSAKWDGGGSRGPILKFSEIHACEFFWSLQGESDIYTYQCHAGPRKPLWNMSRAQKRLPWDPMKRTAQARGMITSPRLMSHRRREPCVSQGLPPCPETGGQGQQADTQSHGEWKGKKLNLPGKKCLCSLKRKKKKLNKKKWKKENRPHKEHLPCTCYGVFEP